MLPKVSLTGLEDGIKGGLETEVGSEKTEELMGTKLRIRLQTSTKEYRAAIDWYMVRRCDQVSNREGTWALWERWEIGTVYSRKVLRWR